MYQKCCPPLLTGTFKNLSAGPIIPLVSLTLTSLAPPTSDICPAPLYLVWSDSSSQSCSHAAIWGWAGRLYREQVPWSCRISERISNSYGGDGETGEELECRPAQIHGGRQRFEGPAIVNGPSYSSHDSHYYSMTGVRLIHSPASCPSYWVSLKRR